MRRAGETDWSPALRGDIFCIGDSIRTQRYGRALVLLPDETSFRLDQDTTITIVPSQDESRSWLDVLRGVIYIISRDPRALGILTPFANAGIEGTEFLVAVEEELASVTVFEGTVAVVNSAGQASVGSGQRVIARAGQIPVPQTVIRPRDAVQWTLYYSPVLAQDLPGPDAVPSPQRVNDASFYAGRAGARLSVGHVDEANDDIRQALMLDAGNADALSLQAIIAVTQNDKAEALRLANQAVAEDPASAAALIAQSYARQAFFDVSGALASLQSAVERAPDNALAWARVSELWLAVGDVNQSLNAAEQAVALNPGVARTQTVLGFAYLSRVELTDAMDAFNEAIALDEGAPLPRLGLGLALIREGELVAGREELYLAVMLDPGNALIRSYMGKAYYEEKRDDLAESQLEIAKDLDPLDPTPFFYDAIRKQTTNRPGEALEDIQESIELNDNRAVYRSRLLLDEDLAARSASLARIYRDIGFTRSALVEGWNSVDIDPADYSGHRLLADLYSELPRHQVARVNSLFKSQLLQPLNVSPIQPQLAEANPFILDSAGPSDLAFNEFNPLFNRNDLSFQVDGVTGGNNTQGESVAVSGISDRFSYSVGGFDFETDGFRENNDFEQDVFNAFIQFRASPKTSWQAELRTADTEHGDLALRFEPTNFVPNRRSLQEAETARVGVKHSINDRSIFLGSLIYQDVTGTDQQLPLFTSDGQTDSHSLDLQFLHRRNNWHVTTGINQIDLDQSSLSMLTVFVPFPIEQTIESATNSDISSAYVYATLSSLDRVSFTIGVSYDDISSDARDDDWFNPKLGLIWRISSRATLRAATFRTVQAPFVSRQIIQPRLEPTQVSGFNQFFFGTPDEVVEHYGIGFDYEASSQVSAGIEVSDRNIDFPFLDFTVMPPQPKSVPIDRSAISLYANYLAAPRIALNAEFQYENSDNRGLFLGEGFSKLQTRRLPLTLTYHHPNGFSGVVTATFVEQEGNFEDLSGPPPFPVVSLRDSFAVLDASLRYRLPNRHGVVALVVNNLLDEEFRFQDSDPENPRIFPERIGFLRFTVAF